ncbi:hypothetical protein K1T71_010302 [Dendrolimus kikuchii]|uniref:Uncharacterized protein n=1 Tax=Dendrolimus kikuchii TaxID=765133 RepID=A0ACC1CRK0_9NEOP|nr:hypothetical protein K1T71_010302 [Dendrolimus kikuchii]
MPEPVNSDPTFIKRILNGDEIWVYEFNMQTNQQALGILTGRSNSKEIILFKLCVAESNEEIRYILKFYYKKGKTATQAAKKICDVYGPNAVSVRVAQIWFKRFESGNFDIKDARRSGRPVTDKIDAIFEKVEQDRHISSYDVAGEVGIDHKTVLAHLKKAGYTKKLDIWLITGDEKWITYGKNVRKRSWSKAGQALQTVAKPGLTRNKVMLCVCEITFRNPGNDGFFRMTEIRTKKETIKQNVLIYALCNLNSRNPGENISKVTFMQCYVVGLICYEYIIDTVPYRSIGLFVPLARILTKDINVSEIRPVAAPMFNDANNFEPADERNTPLVIYLIESSYRRLWRRQSFANLKRDAITPFISTPLGVYAVVKYSDYHKRGVFVIQCAPLGDACRRDLRNGGPLSFAHPLRAGLNGINGSNWACQADDECGSSGRRRNLAFHLHTGAISIIYTHRFLLLWFRL